MAGAGIVRQFEPDGDKEGAPACVACVADSRSEVEQDPLIPVTTHSLPKQTFEERQQQLFLLYGKAVSVLWAENHATIL